MKNIVSVDSKVRISNFKRYYPFYPVGVYIKDLVNANAGDVWGPFETLQGYDAVYLASIKKVKPAPFDQERKQIEENLKTTLTDTYHFRNRQELIARANPRMYNDAIVKLVEKFVPDKREWPGVYRNMVLMDYDFEGDRHPYTVADFIEFVNCEPLFFGSLSDVDDLKDMFIAYLNDIFLWAEAREMNIESNKDFLVFRKLFRNKLYKQYYEKSIVNQKVVFTETDVKDYYNKNKDKFSVFETAVVSVFKFENPQAAFDSLSSLKSLQKDASGTITGHVDFVSNLEKEEIHSSDTMLNSNFITAISKLNPGQVSMPVNVNDGFWVIYLIRKRGQVCLPFKHAEADVSHILSGIKKKEVYNELLAALKSRYPETINHFSEYNVK